jgi:hypothetical protein
MILHPNEQNASQTVHSRCQDPATNGNSHCKWREWESEISRSHSDEHEKSFGTLRHAVSYKTTYVSGVFIASIIKATSLFLSFVSFCNQLGPEAVRDSTGRPVVGLIPHTGANKRSLREMRRLAVDRGRWKQFVEAPLTLWGTMGKRKKKFPFALLTSTWNVPVYLFRLSIQTCGIIPSMADRHKVYPQKDIKTGTVHMYCIKDSNPAYNCLLLHAPQTTRRKKGDGETGGREGEKGFVWFVFLLYNLSFTSHSISQPVVHTWKERNRPKYRTSS